MSMLAERRRKQKWSLNPRGKFWSEDSNKFGQKLMEKMGWSQGKGLGAKENGVTEHIKVSYKNDSQGIGYKETDEQWTEHQADFKAVLAALAGEQQTTGEVKLSSLEKKSEGSKVRVHYKKFTRGKDLSKRSEKDLACIFGKKSLKGIKKAEVVTSELGVQEPKEEDKHFSNAGLMSDYFKKKLPNFGKTNGCIVGNNGVLKKADYEEAMPSFDCSNGFPENGNDSDSDVKPHFGFGFQRSMTEDISSENNNLMSNKRSLLKASFVSYISESNNSQDTSNKSKKKKRSLDDSTNIEDTPTKKKKLDQTFAEDNSITKKKKSKKNKGADSGLENPAFDPLYSSVKLDKHVLESIEENSFNESPNETLNDTVGQVAETFEMQVQINNDVTPIESKRDSIGDLSEKKKKRKKGKAIVSDQSQDIQISINETEELETSKKEKRDVEQMFCLTELESTPDSKISGSGRRKKKSKKDDSEHNVESMDITNANCETDCSESAVKSRKKEKIRRQEVEALDNSVSAVEDNNTKKKKSKKCKGGGLDNPLFDIGVENVTLPSQEQNSYEIKIKPKKKSKNKETIGVENPIFNSEDSVNTQDVLNEEYEVRRKDKSKKKKRKDREEDNKGLDNPALNLDAPVIESFDLMLNVVTTPIQPTISKDTSGQLSIQRVKKTERRKSVRFSDVTRERIIPSKEEVDNEILDHSRDFLEIQGKLNDSSDMSYIDKFLQKKKAQKEMKGLENVAFDQYANNIEENITSMKNTLDNYQAEIENDMNEAMVKSVEIEDIMIGEVGNPDGTDEKLPDGSVKLKFRKASFQKARPKFMDSFTGAKKSYTHLIKGDIVVGFKESNLHEIPGYAVVAQSHN